MDRTRPFAIALLLFLLCAGCERDATGPHLEATPGTARDSVMSLSNAARAQAGMAPLAGDDRLHEVASAHARDMAVRGYFSHVTPEGRTLAHRLRDAGVSYRAAGENIAGNASAAGAVEAWLTSDGHRRNILDPSFGRLGVGVHREANSPFTYYVQVFTN
jgi:uncharacterized protein YkwD